MVARRRRHRIPAISARPTNGGYQLGPVDMLQRGGPLLRSVALSAGRMRGEPFDVASDCALDPLGAGAG
jgi:hypothetical protein